MVLHRYVLALDIAGLVEALAEPGNNDHIGRSRVDEADNWHGRLLRARHERPRRSRAADERDELAALHHSITSSARPSSGSGIVRPRTLAVIRLMISSTFTACWTGRSAGFSPLRRRPT